MANMVPIATNATTHNWQPHNAGELLLLKGTDDDCIVVAVTTKSAEAGKPNGYVRLDGKEPFSFREPVLTRGTGLDMRSAKVDIVMDQHGENSDWMPGLIVLSHTYPAPCLVISRSSIFYWLRLDDWCVVEAGEAFYKTKAWELRLSRPGSLDIVLSSGSQARD